MDHGFGAGLVLRSSLSNGKTDFPVRAKKRSLMEDHCDLLRGRLFHCPLLSSLATVGRQGL